MLRQEIDVLQEEIHKCRDDLQDEQRGLMRKRWQARTSDEEIENINDDFDALEDKHNININNLVLILQNMIQKQTLLDTEELENPFRSIGINESSVIKDIVHMANLVPVRFRCPGENPGYYYYGGASMKFEEKIDGMCYFCGKKARVWICYENFRGNTRHC